MAQQQAETAEKVEKMRQEFALLQQDKDIQKDILVTEIGSQNLARQFDIDGNKQNDLIQKEIIVIDQKERELKNKLEFEREKMKLEHEIEIEKLKNKLEVEN